MNLLFNEEASEWFFIVGTAVVLSIAYFGYAKGKFSSYLSTLAVCVFVTYAGAFLLFRYLSGNMERHEAASPSYVALGALHGTIALLALIVAAVVIVLAERHFRRGENYFRLHRNVTVLMVALWPLALLTGFLLG